jgi:hypothetical protein
MATIPKPHARQPPRFIWKVGEERAALLRLLYAQPQAGSNTAQSRNGQRRKEGKTGEENDEAHHRDQPSSRSVVSRPRSSSGFP